MDDYVPLPPVEIHRAHCDCVECWIGYSRPANHRNSGRGMMARLMSVREKIAEVIYDETSVDAARACEIAAMILRIPALSKGPDNGK